MKTNTLNEERETLRQIFYRQGTWEIGSDEWVVSEEYNRWRRSLAAYLRLQAIIKRFTHEN
jgi:hypothetical protein